jgi:hypothetical protein
VALGLGGSGLGGVTAAAVSYLSAAMASGIANLFDRRRLALRRRLGVSAFAVEAEIFEAKAFVLIGQRAKFVFQCADRVRQASDYRVHFSHPLVEKFGRRLDNGERGVVDAFGDIANSGRLIPPLRQPRGVPEIDRPWNIAWLERGALRLRLPFGAAWRSASWASLIGLSFRGRGFVRASAG